jgi:hypothetical protein
MRQRLWPVTGATPEELRQALIDSIVQGILECSDSLAKRDKSQKGSKHRERMIEALFRAAAAEAESRR